MALLIGSTCLTGTLHAQIKPVSTFSFQDELWLDGSESDSSAWPAALSSTSAWGFVEVPFGTPELQVSWFGINFRSLKRSVGLVVSRSGFDQLHQTDVGVSLVHLLQTASAVRLQVGASHFNLGKLDSRIEANWRADWVLKSNQFITFEGGVRRRSGIGKKGLGPSELSVRSLVKLNPSVSLSATLISSATHSLQLEAAFGYSLAQSIQFDLGFESSRSMMFLDLLYKSRSIQAGLYVSFHPVLGRSVGSSVRWVFE
ncbi:hypothetical protein HQ496_04630 [bacterium]|nr:hypothetical protein [bacterium]